LGRLNDNRFGYRRFDPEDRFHICYHEKRCNHTENARNQFGNHYSNHKPFLSVHPNRSFLRARDHAFREKSLPLLFSGVTLN
jgi:hypothetical protein